MGSGGAPFSGGFVAGPEASWTADLSGTLSKAGDLLVTDHKPTLTGSGFSSSDTGSYDLVAKRWLPVARAQVRGDGLAYAYAESFTSKPNSLNDSTRIHVVSLADGTDRVVYSGAPRSVLAYEKDGIFITSVVYYRDGLGGGLWRLDPVTGAAAEIPNGAPFEAVAGQYAFSDGGVIMPRTLVRVDIRTGAQETWFHTDGPGWIWFVGIDGRGHPIIDVSPDVPGPKWQLEVVSSPQVVTMIATATIHTLGVTDSHGTWLAGDDGVYLLRPDSTLVRVSDVTGGNVAGGCS